jgi:hypothetical protein
MNTRSFQSLRVMVCAGKGGLKARSSGGERYLDAVEVWGSNPHVPTIEINSLKSET